MAEFFHTVGLLAVALFLGSLLLSLAKGAYSVLIAPALGLGVDWAALQGWAVVTGATDGIGKEYAKQLAKKGFNMVLISRNQQKLDNTAEEIESLYHVNTQTIAVDFTKDLDIYDFIKRQLRDINVAILVNNVGMSYETFEYFSNLDNRTDFCRDIVRVNVYSAMMMMDILLPQMEKKKSGVIINIASLSALDPVPLLSVYSASKAFLDFLSQALEVEYNSRGIVIQTVLPGFVDTKMIDKVTPKTFSNSAPSFVSWALSTVGVESRTFGHPTHKFQAWWMTNGARYLPTPLYIKIKYFMVKYLRRQAARETSKADDSSKTTVRIG